FVCNPANSPSARRENLKHRPIAELVPCHKSGYVLRFPQIRRIRWDKPAAEADKIEAVAAMAGEREDHPWCAVARSCPYVRRDTSSHCGQRLCAPGKRTVIAQDTAGVSPDTG